MNRQPLSAAIDRLANRRYEPQRSASNKLADDGVLCGIEIEVEDFAGGFGRIDDVWTQHNDGSLVGGVEFVLHPPRNGKRLDEGIDLFFDARFQYTGGERTSVHIHMDMADGTTIGQFRSLFSLAYIFEGAIYRIADENRKWAGYSAPLIDMPPLRLNRILNGKTIGTFQAGVTGQRHEDRYYGFNSCALAKHGTIEFRYFPCTNDKAVMYQWLNLCLELKTASRKFHEPSEMMALFGSEEQLTVFVREHLPRSADALLQYMDRVDALERARIISAMLDDAGGADGLHKVPRNSGVSKSLKKVAEKLGWHDPQAAAERRAELARHREVQNARELIGADGEFNDAAFDQLLNNIRGRFNRANNA